MYAQFGAIIGVKVIPEISQYLLTKSQPFLYIMNNNNK